MKSTPCDLCKSDPIRRSGRTCCPAHKMYVCAGCKGTDRYVAMHKETDGRDA